MLVSSHPCCALGAYASALHKILAQNFLGGEKKKPKKQKRDAAKLYLSQRTFFFFRFCKAGSMVPGREYAFYKHRLIMIIMSNSQDGCREAHAG